jgi:glycosyltransferase involved in cell wall biosynthesis
LKERIHVEVLGYRSFFPMWLYPGDRDGREIEPALAKGISCHNVLKYYSLMSSVKAANIVRSTVCADVVDVHWSTPFHAPVLMALMGMLRRRNACKILMTVHNVLPHERRLVDKVLCRAAYSMADHLLVHSATMRDQLQREFGIPHDRISEIAHPVCLDRYDPISQTEARKKLGLPQKNILLFFGFVRHYKGLDLVMEAMSELVRTHDVGLVVAGDFLEDRGKYEKLMSRLRIGDATSIFPQFIPTEQAPLFFQAADIVVLPYRNFSGQSGVPQTAYLYQKPVVATAVGGLPDIVHHGRTGMIVPPNDVPALVSALRALLDNPRKREACGSEGEEYLKTELSWGRAAERMAQLYTALSYNRVSSNARQCHTS